jgi:hypothetical protein
MGTQVGINDLASGPTRVAGKSRAFCPGRAAGVSKRFEGGC